MKENNPEKPIGQKTEDRRRNQTTSVFCLRSPVWYVIVPKLSKLKITIKNNIFYTGRPEDGRPRTESSKTSVSRLRSCLPGIRLAHGRQAPVCYIIGFILILSGMLANCRPKEEILTDQKNIQLRISQDSLIFDTLFSSRKSITKRLKIYNDMKGAIMIDRITLGKRDNSSYNLFVNGISGNQFGPLKVLGKDSILVLVEITIPPKNKDEPFRVKDSLVLETKGGAQHVHLLSWGQDVHYIDKLTITGDTVFSAARPYIIGKEIKVEKGKTLEIVRGGRLYFGKNAQMVVNGQLLATGTLEKPILFRNDRFGGEYEKAHGQWKGIIFGKTSRDNRLEHVQIKNATTGVLLKSEDRDTLPDLVLANSTIGFMSEAGIKAQNAELHAYNTVVHNCVQYVIGNFGEGYYHYQHCTFANYFTNFFREQPVFVLADNGAYLEESAGGPIQSSIENSIIWGNLTNEIDIDSVQNPESRLKFKGNLMKTGNSDWADENIINKHPGFENSGKHPFKLTEDATARDKGIQLGIEKDILGNKRDSLPDIGAYEWIKTPENN